MIVFTDEYDIYARLSAFGHTHRTVCRVGGEFTRDNDGDGFCEVYVNTLGGFWSLLRSWHRPHRGLSLERLSFVSGILRVRAQHPQAGQGVVGLLDRDLRNSPESRTGQVHFLPMFGLKKLLQ